jgi:hypothetical protein
MTSAPAPRGHGPALGWLLVGIAVVLLVSSVSWFSSGRTAIGIGQLVLGGVLACAGAVVLRRTGSR